MENKDSNLLSFSQRKRTLTAGEKKKAALISRVKLGQKVKYMGITLIAFKVDCDAKDAWVWFDYKSRGRLLTWYMLHDQLLNVLDCEAKPSFLDKLIKAFSLFDAISAWSKFLKSGGSKQ